MNKLSDVVLMSVPLASVPAIFYFTFSWKPRHTNSKNLARVETAFWTVVLTTQAAVLFYCSYSQFVRR